MCRMSSALTISVSHVIQRKVRVHWNLYIIICLLNEQWSTYLTTGRSKRRVPYKQFMEFERGCIIGMRDGGYSFSKIAAHTRRNATAMRHVWKKWTKENRTSWSHGSDRAHGVLPCVGTALDHGYRCSTFCPHASLTSAKLWAACKDFSAQDFSWRWITDVSGYNGLINTASGVLINNKSCSQMIPTTIWTVTMDV